ncbi:MAG: hypothetical protein RRY53_00470, partial [Pseudoflavonifractor sp.]
CVNLFLQTIWVHRIPFFSPDYPKVDLTDTLEQSALTENDYDTVFQQTGLARPAVDALLAQGPAGVAQITATQEGFFTPSAARCVELIGGHFTCEDRTVDSGGSASYSVPLAPLAPGDIIVSFSTHTFGWRHGHAGLVADPARGITLEAVVMGSDSAQMDVQHWRTYSNFMVLRVKGASDELRRQVADFGFAHLDGIHYGLLSGIFGTKAPPPTEDLVAQCAYLPWYAWQAFDADLDGDGGKIVTVADLASSPLVEVVQVYGIDPAQLSGR